jgi:hypothetical protein
MRLTDGALRARCVLQVVRDDLSTRSTLIAMAAPVSTVAAGGAAFAVCRAERRPLIASLSIAAAGLLVLTGRSRRQPRATAQHGRGRPIGRSIHTAVNSRPRDDGRGAAWTVQLPRVESR